MVDVVVCLSDWQRFLSSDASNSYTVCDIVIENMDSLLMIALCPQCRCHCIIFRPSFDPLPSMRARRLRVLYPFRCIAWLRGGSTELLEFQVPSLYPVRFVRFLARLLLLVYTKCAFTCISSSSSRYECGGISYRCII